MLWKTVDHLGRASVTEFDTALRPRLLRDALANERELHRDANSNITTVTERDVAQVDPARVETHSVHRTFDGLDRTTAWIDEDGQSVRRVYDSEGAIGRQFDQRGNVTRLVHDGLGRLTDIFYELRGSGVGAGSFLGEIHIAQGWDDAGRLIARTDDNGNVTLYEHDDLDRLWRVEHADGTAVEMDHDGLGNEVWRRLADGTEVATQRDALGRVSRADAALGSGVSNLYTFELYQHDGAGNLRLARNDQVAVTRSFDSLGHLRTDTLAGKTTIHDYDVLGNKTLTTYPGGREVERVPDALNRVRHLREQGVTLATFDHIGPSRRERRSLANGTETLYGFDAARRMNSIRHQTSASSVALDQLSFLWSTSNDKLQRHELTGLGWMQTFTYDSVSRLTQSIRDASDSAFDELIAYNLDGVGNRLAVGGDVDWGTYSLSPASPTPGDAQMNQYTNTPFDSRAYDARGNIEALQDGGPFAQNFHFDYMNRLVALSDSTEASYFLYDALGRLWRTQDAGGVNQRFHYHDGDLAIEERDAADNVLATFVHGPDFDEILSMRRSGQEYYFNQDDQQSVTSLTDDAGALVERYRYGDFGRTLFFDALDQPTTGSSVGNPFGFQGRRRDALTGLYYFRARFLDPRSGRFISRDPIGAFRDPVNHGNAFSFVGSNPWSWRDPMGLETWILVADRGEGKGAFGHVGLFVRDPSGRVGIVDFGGGSGSGIDGRARRRTDGDGRLDLDESMALFVDYYADHDRATSGWELDLSPEQEESLLEHIWENFGMFSGEPHDLLRGRHCGTAAWEAYHGHDGAPAEPEGNDMPYHPLFNPLGNVKLEPGVSPSAWRQRLNGGWGAEAYPVKGTVRYEP